MTLTDTSFPSCSSCSWPLTVHKSKAITENKRKTDPVLSEAVKNKQQQKPAEPRNETHPSPKYDLLRPQNKPTQRKMSRLQQNFPLMAFPPQRNI